MASLRITVNGHEHVLDADPDTPLLWILRDHLGLTGTKYGCGEGLCGNCTVLLDGEAVRSCKTTLAESAGRSITTIEGLSTHLDHVLQRAWLAEEVPQCGYCQSGQIMAAAALLARASQPTDAQIDEAMNEILCRCGTYGRIRRAIHRAASGGVR